MKFSQAFIPTLKENPADADTVSAKLMLRAGMVRKLGAGLYEWLPMGLRVLRNVEQIIREEMNRAGALEVWLPNIQPKELWEESGRWQYYGRELLRIKDRKNAEFCFAPTAEEVITDLARRSFKSYRDLPAVFYQFGTKFRDEIRPRFGVMRAREFLMKDAYSFHASNEDLDKTYQTMYDTYSRIFTRLGLKFRPVEADTGSIGGSSSHEFMVLADTGEDQIATCESCGYAANVERAETLKLTNVTHEALLAIEEVATPNRSSVADVAAALNVTPDRVIKTVFMIADSQPVVALLRGDTDVNVPKLQRLLGAQIIRMAKDDEYRDIAGCDVGFAGPMNLKAKVIADFLVEGISNAVTGAGKKDIHLKNVNIGRDYKPELVADIRNIRAGDACPRCGKSISFARGIEVGHVFKLGIKYSKAMQANFLDEAGQAQPMIMGCYGIGVSRIVAAAIEQNHDEWGIRWPLPIAPYDVIITPANVTHEASLQAATQIYKALLEKGISVLFDDRDMRAGFKFKDADLIGVPLRVTIGEKSLARGMVEIKWRTDAAAEEITVDKAVEKVLQLLQAQEG
jgi:prolyl-tRNA synthetase